MRIRTGNKGHKASASTQNTHANILQGNKGHVNTHGQFQTRTSTQNTHARTQRNAKYMFTCIAVENCIVLVSRYAKGLCTSTRLWLDIFKDHFSHSVISIDPYNLKAVYLNSYKHIKISFLHMCWELFDNNYSSFSRNVVCIKYQQRKQ